MHTLIIGYFGYKSNQLDGQTIKTRNIYNVLKENNTIDYFDTENIKYNKLALFELLKMCRDANNIIFIGGRNNLTYFFPILFLISSVKKINIVYAVVGGWLYHYLIDKPSIYTKMLKNTSSILVETQFLKDNLNNLGFDNVSIIPNFRLTPNYSLDNYKVDKEVFRIVFMARITKEKGIYLLFDLVEKYLTDPDKYKKTIQIDFFGPIDSKDRGEFNRLVEHYSSNVSYKGILDPSQIYNKLTSYDILVLPTFYEGEGFPGTIIDAYLSALPVIATKWKQIPEFVKDSHTGYLIDYDITQLSDKVRMLANDQSLLNEMKKNAFEYSHEFSSEKGLEVLTESLRTNK